MAEAIAALERAGAVIVDPADIPSVVDRDPSNNFPAWGICSGADQGRGKDEGCSVVLKYGMKRDFNKWLATLGPSAPVASLAELRAWNTAHRAAGAIKYGQAALDISDEMDVERDRARYEADRAKDLRLAATHGLDEVIRAERLDAVLFPGASGAAIAARPGYPTVIVPFALVPNRPAIEFPSGFEAAAAALRRQLHRSGRAANRGCSNWRTDSSRRPDGGFRRQGRREPRQAGTRGGTLSGRNPPPRWFQRGRGARVASGGRCPLRTY